MKSFRAQRRGGTGGRSGSGSFLKRAVCSLLFFFALGSAARAGVNNLESSLTEYIKSHYPWAEVEVTDIKMNGEEPAGRPERIILERGLPGRTVFLAEYSGERRFSVTANVKAFDRIVMSRRPMPKGAYLHKDDLYVRLMDVSAIPKNAVGNPELLAGKALTRSLVANRPLVSDMVSEAPQLKKGQRVSLLFEADGLSISAVGELRENAYVGSRVKVVNINSKKIVAGLLIDENTVKVEF
ncbi:MAG: flagellar basal body P-ring formation chaperone FlgA [Nitrospiraceae bacterium]|nr:flagellar basal body P-ring formation chaperone FlgA [Nitrospiraceae bacterium]